MFNVVNSSNGITVERNEKDVFKISGILKFHSRSYRRKNKKIFSNLYQNLKRLSPNKGSFFLFYLKKKKN